MTGECKKGQTSHRKKNLDSIRDGKCPLKGGLWPVGDRDPAPPWINALPTYEEMHTIFH